MLIYIPVVSHGSLRTFLGFTVCVFTGMKWSISSASLVCSSVIFVLGEFGVIRFCQLIAAKLAYNAITFFFRVSLDVIVIGSLLLTFKFFTIVMLGR